MNKFFRELISVLVILGLCLSLTACNISEKSTTEPNPEKGYFRDIKNIWGAVVGTSYEQATNEIDMNVTVNGDELTVLATFVDLQMFPYREVEQLGIAAYSIVDANGKVAQEGTTESMEVIDGQATVNIYLNNIDSGNYKLIVTAFVASEGVGDQLLNINGNWECAFTK